jgi:hypothetical protein
VNWLSLPELLAIHADVIDATGSVHGVVNAPALESALARPFTTYGGQPLFPDFVDKLAAMIHSIIAFHPFVDGNKRTRWLRATCSCDSTIKESGRAPAWKSSSGPSRAANRIRNRLRPGGLPTWRSCRANRQEITHDSA